jgi:microsomal dipeptidase-like Zn-dependent dipeptidase
MAARGHVIDAIQYSNWTRRHFEEWLEGGLTAVGVTIAYHERARETLERLAAWNWRLREHADLIRPVRRAADLDAARAEGRIGVLLGAQNCSPIDDDVGLVQVMADAGLKVMQLTYNNLSLIGAGCAELDDPGISRFGREVIQEMNRAGMVIDMSHSAERTTLEAIELSRRPVAVTHANPRFFKDTPRNK